jgi:hypothetical protein
VRRRTYQHVLGMAAIHRWRVPSFRLSLDPPMVSVFERVGE